MTAGDWITIVGIVCLPTVGAVIAVYVSLNGRLVRIETIIEMVGIEALKTLHSDDDHLGLDDYIDKIGENYLEHNYDLTDAEWEEFQHRLVEAMNNPKATPQEKIRLKMYKYLCDHKLMRSGRLARLKE